MIQLTNSHDFPLHDAIAIKLRYINYIKHFCIVSWHFTFQQSVFSVKPSPLTFKLSPKRALCPTNSNKCTIQQRAWKYYITCEAPKLLKFTETKWITVDLLDNLKHPVSTSHTSYSICYIAYRREKLRSVRQGGITCDKAEHWLHH